MANGITTNKELYNMIKDQIQEIKTSIKEHGLSYDLVKDKCNRNEIDLKNLSNIVGNLSRTLNKVIWFVATTFFGAIIVVILYKVFGVK